MRTVVRTLTAVFLALAGPLLAAPAVLAHAQEVQQQSFRTDGASSHQLTVSIDAMNRGYATPTSTVTVSGTITNNTGSPVSGAQVQLMTQAQFFYTRADMNTFAAGGTVGYIFPGPVATDVLSGTLHGGATMHWSASFPAALVNYPEFGVYPLVAQAEFSDGTFSGSARTFLPVWTGSGPKPLKTAWVWPLIDRPQQGPCSQTLATNELAASLATSGRLGTLLAVGQRWAQQDHLTWAVDPALLSDAQVMTSPYEVNANSLCDGTPERASEAAKAWLSSLAGTATEPMFVTPYGDSDAAALTHAGLDSSLLAAYQLGESVAGEILHRPFGTNGESTGDGGSAAVAWPPAGTVDQSVLTSLAANGGISTLVLDSTQLSTTTPPYDNAIASTTTSTGERVGVLLADSQLTGILGSASASSPASAQFTAEQDFLAQTAMITAEAPSEQRSLVIAPPQRWNPSASEARELLSMTSSAPWLSKVDLGSLATAAGQLKAHQSLPVYTVRSTELNAGYLDQATSVGTNVATYKDLLLTPTAGLLRQLSIATAVMWSSAWRGPGVAGGRLAMTKLSDYLDYWEGKVQILDGGTKVLLSGASGQAPVSVQNAGQHPVQVRVRVTVPANSQLVVGDTGTLVTILPGQTTFLRMTVHSAAIGTTQLQLQLVTKNGSPLGPTTTMSVQATRYGRALLVLIAAALGVLVLTSVARWIRRVHGATADSRSGGTG